ncbi:hypothetical protein M9H77_24172 [Catharanthus roseus]|uniref:Uncharacterized protein n=1 Tax=Catharanthus roseus TaxID=4058 RepID=A0ACC0AWB7_CATRO|nr:hypothetical protein M9H77_24172 [Catharanthus roseus]
MVSNIEIVAKEVIKPSSPTPLHHNKNLKLSFLDQLSPPVYVTMIFFYEASQLHGNSSSSYAQVSELLKKSLSNSLTRFYPLAGKIAEDFTIDCNDSGALYVEARVRCQLLQVVENPNMEELREYLPFESKGQVESVKENVVLAIQINFFDCGGIAIGVQMFHRIGDGLSLVTFVKAWAANCRGDDTILEYSNFGVANLFPPRDLSSIGLTQTRGVTAEKIVTKRIVFSKEKLANLKESAASAPEAKVKDPTRVEVVTAWIWRHLLDIQSTKVGTKTSLSAIHAVNLRHRMVPPLPDHAFANLWAPAFAMPMSAGEHTNHYLVGELRSAIRNIDHNYLSKICEDEYLNNLKASQELFAKGEFQYCGFSSWCRFPVYEVDYGWGKPVWVCTTTLPFKNVVILMSTRNGDGIEAWINILEDDDLIFQSYQQMDLSPVAGDLANI